MTNSNTTTLAAGCLGLVMVASPSVAAEWYVGAGVGQTDVPGFSLSDLDDGSLTSGSVDETDTGWTLYGGVRLHKYLGLEADYIDLGTFRIDAVSDGTGTDFAAGPVTAAASADGFSLSALGLIPVGDNFDLFARAGIRTIDTVCAVCGPNPFRTKRKLDANRARIGNSARSSVFFVGRRIFASALL